MEEILLENYNERSAYYGRYKYTIVALGPKRYGFPDTEILQTIIDAEGDRKKSLEDKFPVLEITQENLALNEASALNANGERQYLLKKLMEMRK